jgi:hypothetical protein
MPEFYVDTIKGEGAGKAFHFEIELVRVGRSDESELVFDEMGVSWEHAEFRYRNGDYWIVDGGSTNGTYVNDERAHNARLKEGDVVRFGKKGPVVRFRLTKPDSIIVPQSSAEHPSAIAKRRKRPRLPSEVEIPVPNIPGLNADGDPNEGYSDLPPAGSILPAAKASSLLLIVPSLLFCGALILMAMLYVEFQEQELTLIQAQDDRADAVGKLEALETSSREFEEVALADERRKVDRLERDLARVERERRKWEDRLDDAQRDLKNRERELARARGDVSRLRRELDRARERARQQSFRPPSNGGGTKQASVASWQQIERRLSPSVVFIATRITAINPAGRRVDLHVFGTGFFVSSRGHIVTNKHVIQPWKFQAHAVRMAKEGLEIDMSSYKVHCWPGGARFLKRGHGKSGFNLTTGFSTENGTLEIVRTAPDQWASMALGGDGPRRIQVHQNGDGDLAILKAKTTRIAPIPLGKSDAVQKLDEVLVLGFPAGPAVLEAGIAETSPARGTVRKVEHTIHVSAAMLGGNSGGPLIDRHGRVIGVSTMVVKGTETLGSCLRIEHAAELLHGGRW